VVVVFAAQIGFVRKRGLEQSDVVEIEFDPLLELSEVLFPFGILLGDLLAVEIFNDLADYRVHFTSITDVEQDADPAGFLPSQE